MKKQIIFFLLLFACGNILFAQQTKGVFICNEGVWGEGNGNIAHIDGEDSQSVTIDYFKEKNNRNIGDTPTDIKVYGSKVYIVVNISNQIEILDANTGKSLKQIPMLNRQPRYIAFCKDKAYITAFDGNVYRIDTASMEIDGSVAVGRNPEGICAVGNKLYVANSGGLDYPNYDHTVSVVDIVSFLEIKKIEVGINPYKLLPDGYGNVYVTVRGNNNDIPCSFKRIDIATEEVESFAIEALNFDIFGKFAYLYNYNYSTNTSWIKRFNLETKTLENNSFITDGTTISYPYGIFVNPANGNVYITNAGENYTSEGDLFCFDSIGKLKFEIENIGVGPCAVAFFNPHIITGISQNIATEKNITIYPNPTTNVVCIENAALSKVHIFDQKGSSKGSYFLPSNSEKINIQHFPTGIYFITLTGKDNIQTIKIIKK